MTEQTPSPWTSPVVILATGLGVGALPLVPGTIGALWGIPITMGLAGLESLALRVLILVMLILVGVPICGWAAQALGKKDPGAVVWDEFVTVPVVFLFVPLSLWRHPWASGRWIRVASGVRYLEGASGQLCRTPAGRLGHHVGRRGGSAVCGGVHVGDRVFGMDAIIRLTPSRASRQIGRSIVDRAGVYVSAALRLWPGVKRIMRMKGTSLDRQTA